MRRMMGVVLFCVGATGTAGALPPRAQHKVEVLQKRAEEQKRLEAEQKQAAAPGFVFVPPAGYAPVAPPPNQPPTHLNAYAAAGDQPVPGKMMAHVEATAVDVTDEKYAEDQGKQLGDKYTTAFSGGSFKVVKHQVVRVEGMPVLRLLIEMRPDAKKKPDRSLHFILGLGNQHAHVSYTASGSGFRKLEKVYDESLRQTVIASTPKAATKP